MEIMKENCRLCQKDLGTITIDENISRIILELAKIEMNESISELLPSNICLQCNNRVLEMNLFIQEIKSVDLFLKSYMEQYLNNKNIILDENDMKVLENCEQPLEHPTDNFMCTVCSKSCNRLSSYKKHTKTHPEMYCAKCNTFFNNITESVNHKCVNIMVKRRKIHMRIKTDNKSDEDIDYPNDAAYIQCTKCEESFEDDNSLTNHLESHNNYTCTEKNCSKVYTTAYSLKIHKLNHEGKRSFLCVSCGKDFISKKSLICHEKIHAAVKAHKCDSCNLSFSVRSNLRAHIKRYHEGVRYHCSKCPREFLTKCNLDRHEKIHTGIREFKCDHCTSAFYTKKELLKHQRYHQGIKQHKCEQCFKTFFERHHLIIHLRSHSGERPYVCEVPECGKSFYDNQKLKRHQKAVHNHKNEK